MLAIICLLLLIPGIIFFKAMEGSKVAGVIICLSLPLFLIALALIH